MTFIIAFCIIGVTTGIFLSSQFLIRNKNQVNTDTILGLFFWLLSIRIGKLLIQEFASEAIQSLYFNLMHASYLALGPIILWYTYSYFKLSRKISLGHFMPSLFFLLSAFHLRQFAGESIWIPIYWAMQVHPVYYIMVCFQTLIRQRNKQSIPKIQIGWLTVLYSGVLLIMLMNVLYYLLNFPFYVVTSSLMIFMAYLIISLAFQNQLMVFNGGSKIKYQNLKISKQEILEIWEKVQSQLLDRQLYLNENLRLSQVASRVHRPSYVVSMVINQQSGKSFKEYINSLRIEEAKSKLTTQNQMKILAVALDSGFSSLSAFNEAFKKHTGLNPSDFRSLHLK